MAKIPFKVSARTAKLIGLENFSNEEGAIIELVKNTYDADARNCVLIFDLQFIKVNQENEEIKEILDKEKSSIYIIDNGVGMTDEIISNQWMTIGTDNKLYKHLTEKGRVKTGAKGIGRFALNRLGLMTKLLTISKETCLGYSWEVSWGDFDKANTTVSQVQADLEKISDLNLKNEIVSKFNHIAGLKDLLKSTTFDSGTIIKISNLTDDWEFDQLEKLFGNLEMLLPPKEQSDFDIHFYSTSQTESFGKVKSAYYDDFDYKIKAKYLDDENKTLELKITRNELDVDALENRYKEVFDYKDMSKHPYRLEDFRSKTFTINTSLGTVLSSDVEKELINKIGKFGFTFYYLKNTISDDKKDGDLKKYPYNSFNSSNRKAWLKKFGGVKVFRDDFRVRPYGENGEDWLKLGERQAKSPGGAGQKLGGFRIRPNQIAGTINISRIHNLSFQDKSGREGIRENEVFDLFKNILEEIISLFEKDRNTIMFHLSELHKKRNKEEEAKRKAQEEADRINNEEENTGEENNSNDVNENDSQGKSKSTETEKSLAKGVKLLTEEIEEKEEEIRLLRNLASVGLIISSFAHEVKSLRSRLIPRTTHLIKELRNHLNEKELKLSVDKDDNPFYMIRLIQEEDTKLKHWLEYSLNTLKRDKRERRNLDFNDYFNRFKSTWSKALEQRNIQISLKTEKHQSNKIRAFEVDMDSIFNNLLSNSLNALKGKKDDQKSIEISWKKVGENIEIIFSDNGKGLDKQYQENPDDIFKLLETSKKDKTGNIIGTGLGLYIVKSIIEEYNNSTISIIKAQSGLSLKITFKTRK
ncbi:sensor histidine kinase [Kordia jejudonensis]|uniref:sensor histidine kinase n=1 Tax=Kordia jejudonensis TaxID=1348245 RepID=UPI0006291B7B|nr:sensor histidine kinase [Kordia jejudonensis]